MAPLFEVDATFVSLAKEVRESDSLDLAWSPLIDVSQQLETFADTAALISELDLVISADTSVAHLAGALGKPVWILIPFVPCWRWMLDREDSPWYPTARLFRQSTRDDWAGVINRVRDALQQLKPEN
jgi:ADP-heptose:LPS heptosyltransferase